MTMTTVKSMIGACLIAITAVAPAQAQDKAPGMGGEDLRVFFGQDDRQFVDSTVYPWSAIGKLVLQSGGHCSGAMVAPNVVLTAAHCLFMGDGSRRIDPPARFMAGYDRGQFVASAGAVGHYVPPGYDPVRHLETSDLDGLDYAFVVLDQDIGNRTGTFQMHNLTYQDLEAALRGQWLRVSQAGYSFDNADRLTAHIGCPITHYFDDDTIFHQCDTLQGDNGSPLFVQINGEYHIIGLESATYFNPEGQYDWNMAVDARAFFTEFSGFVAASAPGTTTEIKH